MVVVRTVLVHSALTILVALGAVPPAAAMLGGEVTLEFTGLGDHTPPNKLL